MVFRCTLNCKPMPATFCGMPAKPAQFINHFQSNGNFGILFTHNHFIYLFLLFDYIISHLAGKINMEYCTNIQVKICATWLIMQNSHRCGTSAVGSDASKNRSKIFKMQGKKCKIKAAERLGVRKTDLLAIAFGLLEITQELLTFACRFLLIRHTQKCDCFHLELQSQ